MTAISTRNAGNRGLPGRALIVLGILVLGATCAAGLLRTALIRGLRAPAQLVDVRPMLLESLDIERNSEIQLTLPTAVMKVGRAGLRSFGLPHDAECALRSVDGGRVGVYELTTTPTANDRLRLLQAADTTLCEAHGWTRIVAVIQEEAMVAVYAVEEELSVDGRTDLCLVVAEDRRLVIASVRANLRPVMQLATSALEVGHRNPNSLGPIAFDRFTWAHAR